MEIQMLSPNNEAVIVKLIINKCQHNDFMLEYHDHDDFYRNHTHTHHRHHHPHHHHQGNHQSVTYRYREFPVPGFLVVSEQVSEQIGTGKKVSEPVSEKFGTGKKSRTVK